MKRAKEKRKKMYCFPYNGSNGIVICCKCCGAEFEETDNGYYPPLKYEDERYNRKCRSCRYYD